jgi:hypothetical protein
MQRPVDRLARRRRFVLAATSVLLAAAGVAVWTDTSGAAPTAAGPDVTVFVLLGFSNYTPGGAVNGYRAYSIGTTSCNQGDTNLSWCTNAGGCSNGRQQNDHPVIAQNLYRLKPIPPATDPVVDGRFEQVGASWLKHGFTALANSATGCGDGSCNNPGTGTYLGVGCTDPYTSGLNGTQSNLGPRSEVDPTTGEFPMPFGAGDSSTAIGKRLQVLDTDLDPSLNVGALYWGEGHYVSPDDAMAGNGLNNASYQPVSVGATAARTLTLTGSIVREKSAIEVWPVVDPTVVLTNIDIPGVVPTERYHMARKVTDLGGGQWRYVYAVHNMNARDEARAFEVRFPVTATITNIGFHDVDHHSGDGGLATPYDNTDWTSSTCRSSVRWSSSASLAANPKANALRWGTMFTFWFDANLDPTSISERLDMMDGGTVFSDGLESGDDLGWCEGVQSP